MRVTNSTNFHFDYAVHGSGTKPSSVAGPRTFFFKGALSFPHIANAARMLTIRHKLHDGMFFMKGHPDNCVMHGKMIIEWRIHACED
jgi:hypothetical protein